MHSPHDPYPTFATGRLIANAASEHSRNTGAPEELTGIAALTSAAAAVQDLFDVKRPDLPPSPTTAFVFVSVESGEGKSTGAKVFLQAHENLQVQMDAQAQEPHEFEASQMVWKEELAHMRAEVRHLIDEEKATEQVKASIARHLGNRPKMQPRTKLLYDNSTPTALRRNLAAWPSGLIVAMDGGHVLNGKVGGDYDLWNSVWDGDTIRTDTADDSFTAYGPRLSALIFTQPLPTLRYFKRRGEEAHGTGFFARADWAFLPPTKGTRLPYVGPRTHEAVATYQARVTHLLEERIRTRKAGDNSRHAMGFTPDAAAYFRDLYQRTLGMSAPGGALQGLGGYAAKIAERVARYACVIHVFNDMPGLIGAETLSQAELIIQWHSRQFLNLLVLTSPQTEAMHDGQWLEQLLWQAAQRSEMIRPADLQRVCPFDWGRPRRNRALQVLCTSGRARIERWKHVQYVQLSSMPQLSISLSAWDAIKQKK